MEDKIEVGEYVRTKNGIIYKIENGEEFYADIIDVGIGIIPDVDGIWIDEEHLDYIDKRDIVKHSKQLVDLIDVGDFVNGFPILEPIYNGNTMYGIDEGYENFKKSFGEIKTILTKEQFEANCYKVGGLYGRNQ